MNVGQIVFAQLMELLPRQAFTSAIKRYDGTAHVLRFSCRDQLLCMIFAQLTTRSSLRETVLCLRALGTRRYHCGIRGAVAKSTLADANERRDFRIFRDLALAMITTTREQLPTDPDLQAFAGAVYAIDSTTLDLCLKLFPWAVFRRHKGAVKAHTLLDIKAGIPVFMRVTHGKIGESSFLDHFLPEAGAYYIMDRGYNDFARFYRLHTAGAFFVTRAKRGLDFAVRQRQRDLPAGPVRSDRLIRLRGPKSKQLYPDTLRLIRYVDPESGKRLVFLTNNLTLDPLTIALLYRKRWQIELFFKWIKQHLHIKAFFGTTPNAVQTQLWIAVIVFMLVVRCKHRYQLPQELNEIFQILSVTILEKTPMFSLFSENIRQLEPDDICKQPSLFEL